MLFSLQGTYYPHLVRMFYANMHSITTRVTFWVTMYDQLFLVFSHSNRHALDMLRLEAHVPFFSLKVQALIREELDAIPTSLYDALCHIPSYISNVGFSKPTQLLTTFFNYSFYTSTHSTQIHRSSTWFIHAILFGQQFDIS